MIVKKAGCILLDVNNKKIALIYRKKLNDYSFPKGHLESGETLEKCAVRETEEETGRLCSVISSKKLPVVKYTDSRGNCVEVSYFFAVDKGLSSAAFEPELVHELIWKPFEEVENMLSYSNLKIFWNETKLIVNEIFNS